MSKNIPLPRLVDASGNTLRRINTLGVTIELTIVPLSYASMRLPAGESLPARGFVELYTLMGSVGIFRVRSPKDTYGSPEGSAELEHAIVEVGDYLVKHKYDEMMAASTAMTTIFSHYGGNKWQLGSVSAMGSSQIAVEANYDSVLVAMNALLDQVPDCMMSFDFSTHPWTVNIVKRDSTVSAEGRLSRNVNYANITYDDTELCTRAYYEVSLTDSETGETTSEWRYIDADTIGTYGLIEREVQTGSSFTEDEALSVATEYLNKHKRPKISIEINGYVLSRITGEPLDSFTIGKMFRLALDEYGTSVEENITGLSFSDVYGKPESVTVRLAEEEDSALTFLHDLDTNGESAIANGGSGSTGRGGGGGGKKRDDMWKEYRTRIEQDDYHIGLISERVDRSDNILQQAGMDIDSRTGVIIWHDDNENMMQAKLNVNAAAITSEVSRATLAEGIMRSQIAHNADSITAEVTRASLAEGVLDGRIVVEAGKITQMVSAVGWNGEVTAASIVLAINQSSGQSEAKIDADHVYIGNDKSTTVISGKLNASDVTANYIQGKINDLAVLNAGSMTTGSIDVEGTMESATVSTGNCICDNLNGNDADNIIVNASVSGNTLTLTKSNGTPVTFSKAITSASWAWSNGAPVVTLSPQGQSFTGDGVDGVYKRGDPTWASDYKSVRQNVRIDSEGGTTIKNDYVDLNTTPAYNAGSSAGYSSGRASVTVGVSISYSSALHVYVANALGSNGATDSETSGHEAYDAGYNAGYNAALSDAGIPNGGTVYTGTWRGSLWDAPHQSANRVNNCVSGATGHKLSKKT